MKKLLAGLVAIALFSGCKKDKEEDFTERDQQIIKQYIADHNLDAQSTTSGLHYVIETQGTGPQPSSDSDVRVKYKGYLPSGAIFDQSSSSGSKFNLTQVIKGWQEGIPKFKEGGSGILLIPSALGYGDRATGDIPANAVLIFEIDLLEVY